MNKFAVSFALFMVLISSLALAQARIPREGLVSLDFHDVDIQDIAKSISEITGKNFVLDDKVRGKITIISPAPVSIEEAYQAFLSALEVKNLTAIDVGKVTKIVPRRTAKEGAIRTVTDQAGAYGDELVTQLIPLQFISANEIREALNNLVSRSGGIVAYGPTNTLIVTDSASNIRRLMKIIQKLDKEGFQQSVQVIPIKYAGAGDIAEKLLNIFEKEKGKGARTRRGDVERGDEISRIMSDDRTNSLIVMATREGLGRVLDLVAELDRQVEIAIDRGRIHVKYLQHADAEELASVMQGLLSGATPAKKKKKDAAAAKKEQLKKQPMPWESTAPTTTEETEEQPAEPSSGTSAIVKKGGMFEDEVRIAADNSTNALVITASPSDYEALLPVIEQLDVRRPQVFVEALIMEVSVRKNVDVGVSGYGTAKPSDNLALLGMSNLGLSPLALSGIKNQGDAATAAGSLASGLVLGGISPREFKIPGTNVKIPMNGALFRALQANTALNILSAPNILTSDNKKAEILVGNEVPFMTSNFTGADGKPVTNFDRKKVGIQLSVTPQINEGDEVTLEIEQKIEEVEPRPSDSQFKDLVTSERAAKTTVVAQNSQTIVIGGLIKDKDSKAVSKVPLLGDIPLLGYLFRNTSVVKEKVNLIIFLTPHVVHDPMDLSRVAVKKNNERRRFNKTQGIGENKALYDYDLDKGLNMAPPPPSSRRELNHEKKRFDYDKPEESQPATTPSEEDVLSRRMPRRSKARVTSVDQADANNASSTTTKPRRKKEPVSIAGNPFAEVRPPSSTSY
ncbi:MAG TPA: type II secretion system secretin GspD [Bdellovibrionota bacterium]|nr:type II secretion system secretin GspD [Bdellovibrionota bacterium]